MLIIMTSCVFTTVFRKVRVCKSSVHCTVTLTSHVAYFAVTNCYMREFDSGVLLLEYWPYSGTGFGSVGHRSYGSLVIQCDPLPALTRTACLILVFRLALADGHAVNKLMNLRLHQMPALPLFFMLRSIGLQRQLLTVIHVHGPLQ
jgi:hypothetical protein